jgi:hypothetical protein
MTPEIPCTVLSVAHNFDHDVQIGPTTYLPRVHCTGWVGFYYFVQIDQEEAALMGLDLRYPASPANAECGLEREGSPLTTEVIRENQITGERIAF